MSFEYFCRAVPVVPDTVAGCLAPVAFIIIYLGFVFIVLLNKKYRYLFKWFDDKFGKWY